MSTNPTTSRVSVDDTPTLLIEDVTTPVAKEDGRCTYELYNVGPDVVYLGAEAELDDTGDTGIPLPAGSSRTIAIRLSGKLHGICATGEAAEVAVLRVP